jgi:hypothetical protein
MRGRSRLLARAIAEPLKVLASAEGPLAKAQRVNDLIDCLRLRYRARSMPSSRNDRLPPSPAGPFEAPRMAAVGRLC